VAYVRDQGGGFKTSEIQGPRLYGESGRGQGAASARGNKVSPPLPILSVQTRAGGAQNVTPPPPRIASRTIAQLTAGRRRLGSKPAMLLLSRRFLLNPQKPKSLPLYEDTPWLAGLMRRFFELGKGREHRFEKRDAFASRNELDAHVGIAEYIQEKE
jgi:hypothetical protein